MALTQDDLQAIGALLEPLKADIATIKNDIEQIKEDTSVTREMANGLGDWIEIASDVLKIKYPV